MARVPFNQMHKPLNTEPLHEATFVVVSNRFQTQPPPPAVHAHCLSVSHYCFYSLSSFSAFNFSYGRVAGNANNVERWQHIMALF